MENKITNIVYDDKYIKELEELKIKNDILKSSLDDANITIAKFFEGEKNLNMLLNQQRLVLDKGGIGFNKTNKDRSSRSYFVRATYNTCNYYGTVGHIAHNCTIRKDMSGNAKKRYVWVPKGQVHLVKANPKGPKHKWVSKK